MVVTSCDSATKMYGIDALCFVWSARSGRVRGSTSERSMPDTLDVHTDSSRAIAMCWSGSEEPYHALCHTFFPSQLTDVEFFADDSI